MDATVAQVVTWALESLDPTPANSYANFLGRVVSHAATLSPEVAGVVVSLFWVSTYGDALKRVSQSVAAAQPGVVVLSQERSADQVDLAQVVTSSGSVVLSVSIPPFDVTPHSEGAATWALFRSQVPLTACYDLFIDSRDDLWNAFGDATTSDRLDQMSRDDWEVVIPLLETGKWSFADAVEAARLVQV